MPLEKLAQIVVMKALELRENMVFDPNMIKN